MNGPSNTNFFVSMESIPIITFFTQAGLAPTLVMGIPNTVLYFYAYDELSTQLNRRYPEDRTYIPSIAGASARFIASLSTAPLELLRTRQAARIGAAQGPYAEGKGMITEFRTMIRTEGVSSLGRGVFPTLLRDVPFSAVYWLSIERMKDFWEHRRYQTGIAVKSSSREQAVQSFINGSVSGMIAAAVTTPLDVLKTRSQIDVVQPLGPTATKTASLTAVSSHHHHHQIGQTAVCDHAGALVYHEKPILSTAGTIDRGADVVVNRPQPILSIARNILTTEGIPGLWRGNTTRMMKVAPACGIMISSYEIGKRLLIDDIRS
jgi:solute carrier family 25 protein 39/40